MQHLAVTPELEQALDLLRKSRLELEQAVQELLREVRAVKELPADGDEPKQE
ncbi:MAG TPA: hypothetical protein VJV78_14370 [Polyangiales bacterium]|nr:hypothetical protein [Polyangiales bacterium]